MEGEKSPSGETKMAIKDRVEQLDNCKKQQKELAKEIRMMDMELKQELDLECLSINWSRVRRFYGVGR